MSEQQETPKYIKCSACKCKYLNKDEYIKTDFGYNRLGERFKICMKCRDRRNEYTNSEKGAAAVTAAQKKYYESKGRQYNYEKLVCHTCGASICRNRMREHERQQGCDKNETKHNQC